MDTYSEEQVDQILRYALAKKTHGQSLTKQQIYEIASDMGVSEADFVVSVQEWQSKQSLSKEQIEFDKYKKKSFKSNLLKFAIVSLDLGAGSQKYVGSAPNRDFTPAQFGYFC